MIMQRSDSELRAIRDSVAKVGRLSDGLIRFGPFSLGIDGILTWIPGVGEVYSALAGAFIVIQGSRAGVSPSTLVSAAALLVLRTGVSAVPIAGSAFADLFTAHKWAASMIVKAIDRKLGVDPGKHLRPRHALRFGKSAYQA
jgi:hypothetical protein